jgi:hypothetical protein
MLDDPSRLAPRMPSKLHSASGAVTPLNGKDEAMLRFICSRCLRLWVADAVAHRGTCPYCGGALDETPR